MIDPKDIAAPSFRPLTMNALYTGIARGLAADLHAGQLLARPVQPVCTAHIAASHQQVTDVLEVPTDTIAAQLEHLFGALPEQERPNAAKISIINHPATIHAAFDVLDKVLEGPILLDCTLSGPSGEDIIDAASLDALKERWNEAALVTLRAQDASLVASMELESLDDAQVAVQRIEKLGARRVLLRCGALPHRHFESNGSPSDYEMDLYYDAGEADADAFSLFEAPHVTTDAHGASSLYTLAILASLHRDMPIAQAIQQAKALTTEHLRAHEKQPG